MNRILIVILFVFIFHNVILAQEKKNDFYNKVVCYIVRDKDIVNLICDVSPPHSLDDWDKQMSVSKYILPFDTYGFEYFYKKYSQIELESLNNVLNFEDDSIKINEILCGESVNSPIKLYFSQIKNGYVTVVIGYSDIFGNNRSLPNNSFGKSLSLAFKYDKAKVKLIGVQILQY